MNAPLYETVKRITRQLHGRAGGQDAVVDGLRCLSCAGESGRGAT